MTQCPACFCLLCLSSSRLKPGLYMPGRTSHLVAPESPFPPTAGTEVSRLLTATIPSHVLPVYSVPRLLPAPPGDAIPCRREAGSGLLDHRVHCVCAMPRFVPDSGRRTLCSMPISHPSSWPATTSSRLPSGGLHHPSSPESSYPGHKRPQLASRTTGHSLPSLYCSHAQ